MSSKLRRYSSTFGWWEIFDVDLYKELVESQDQIQRRHFQQQLEAGARLVHPLVFNPADVYAFCWVLESQEPDELVEYSDSSDNNA